MTIIKVRVGLQGNRGLTGLAAPASITVANNIEDIQAIADDLASVNTVAENIESIIEAGANLPTPVEGSANSFVQVKSDETGYELQDTPLLKELGGTPATPGSNLYKLYFKADAKLYQLTSGGVETLVSGISDTVTPITTGASPTIDLSVDSREFTFTTSANAEFTFSNPKATGRADVFYLGLTKAGSGSHTITWPASVKWSNGIAPTLTADSVFYELAFKTTDGGTVWQGYLIGEAMA